MPLTTASVTVSDEIQRVVRRYKDNIQALQKLRLQNRDARIKVLAAMLPRPESESRRLVQKHHVSTLTFSNLIAAHAAARFFVVAAGVIKRPAKQC